VSQTGIGNRTISQTPIAVIDFETTGLTAGFDRVIEVSVIRLDPGHAPRLTFDTLVHPQRPVDATEIHGITDAHVSDAPPFREIAGDLCRTLNGCVVASYNVYFDIKFLLFELEAAGHSLPIPHFCVMYLRPMLGVGDRCSLRAACHQDGVPHNGAHIAAVDAYASALLLARCIGLMQQRDIRTFSDLQKLKNYKFLSSFRHDVFRAPESARPSQYRLKSRVQPNTPAAESPKSAVAPPPDIHTAMRVYWETLLAAVADCTMSAAEVQELRRLQRELGLRPEHLRALHAKVFANAIMYTSSDAWLDDSESKSLKQLFGCLNQLGWAPGT